MKRPDPILEVVQQRLLETREELGRADQKASILIAARAIPLGPLIGLAIGSGWELGGLSLASTWLAIAGIIGIFCGVFSLGYAVYPRVRRFRERAGGLAYYGDIVVLGKDDFRVLDSQSFDQVLDDERDQLWEVSRIVSVKYRAIQMGVIAIGVGAFVSFASVVAERLGA